MKNPGDPILKPTDPVSRYTSEKHEMAEAILINLFHRFHFLFGSPHTHARREVWRMVHRALIHHAYITPNGRFLTDKGFEYVRLKGEEYTHNVQ